MSLVNSIKRSSIEALENNYLYANIYSEYLDKPLVLHFSDSAKSWLYNYKSKNQIESFKQSKVKYNIQILSDYFYIIYYCYIYVIPDLLMIKNLLLRKNTSVLNIGAGLAFHDIFISQMNPEIKDFNIIEKSELEHSDEYSATSNKEKKVNILELSRNNIIDNNQSKKFSFFDEFNYSSINSKFDLIFSFRSWCYKYEIETYLEFMLRCLSDNGYLIVDIRNDFQKNNIIQKFRSINILAEYKNHKRYVLYNIR